MYALDEMTTVRDQRRHEDDSLEFDNDSVISTTLPFSASSCYEVFCDIERLPEWSPMIGSARVLESDEDGRALVGTIIASIGRASMGYTLYYDYDDRKRIVTWRTAETANTLVMGRAIFSPLTDRSAMMHYQLDVNIPESVIAVAADAEADGHAISGVLVDFRDYMSRAFLI